MSTPTKLAQPFEVGNDLVKHSIENPSSAPGIVTELFPYIYEAAGRMSSRSIAAFLNEKHKVGISASTVSRALRRPQLHVDAYVDRVEPAAREVATTLKISNFHSLLLSQNDFLDAANSTSHFSGNSEESDLEAEASFKEAIDKLGKNWWAYGDRFRALALEVLRDRETDEESALEDEHDDAFND